MKSICHARHHDDSTTTHHPCTTSLLEQDKKGSPASSTACESFQCLLLPGKASAHHCVTTAHHCVWSSIVYHRKQAGLGEVLLQSQLQAVFGLQDEELAPQAK